MSMPDFSFKLIVGALIAGILFQWMAGFFVKKWYKQIPFKTFYFNFSPVIGPLRVLIPALTVSLILPLLHLSEPLQSNLAHLVQLWVMLSIGWLLTRVVEIVREAILHKYQMTTANFGGRQIYTQIRIIEHIVNLLIWVLTMALMIMTFSQIKELGTSIFASAGIMTIIIGFAAQKTLGNVIAGIQIAVSQPIRLEDVVVVENECGSIEEITLTYIVVRLWDLRRMVLPISYFIEKPFQNWTRNSTDMLGTVFLYVDYEVSLEKLRVQLDKILQESSSWGKKVNSLQVTDMKEKTLELRVLVDAMDSSTLWDLRCEIREKLLFFLQTQYPEVLPRTRIEMDLKNQSYQTH